MTDLFGVEDFRAKYGRDGISLILYLETRAVDHGGRVDVRHMNKEDMELCPVLVKDNVLASFKRLPAKYIIQHTPTHHGVSSHFVELTSRGWNLVNIFRRERAERMMKETKETMRKYKEDW